MNLLTMKNIHKAYTDKVLFKGADFLSTPVIRLV